jgi:hypothetical protein
MQLKLSYALMLLRRQANEWPTREIVLKMEKKCLWLEFVSA